jgi:hypothetical protein
MEQEYLEQEYLDDDGLSGCALIYGMLLAFGTLTIAVYVLLTGIPPQVARALGGAPIAAGVILLSVLLALVVAAGLWRGQVWARWLVFLLHSAGALLGLGVALLPLFLARDGGRTVVALASPATALMGVVVNIVIVAWFWRNRDTRDEL